MKGRYFHGLWVTGVALSSQYNWKTKFKLSAEKVHEKPIEIKKIDDQKSCIIVIGTTGKLFFSHFEKIQ